MDHPKNTLLIYAETKADGTQTPTREEQEALRNWSGHRPYFNPDYWTHLVVNPDKVEWVDLKDRPQEKT